MASQTDLDQGGTRRQFERRWLGPSVGWVWVPVENILPVTTAGTVTPVNGTTLVTLNVAGLVTVQLWNPIPPSDTPANSIPGPNLGLPLSIIDVGGNCGSFPCTILPPAGKTIMGLASIDIAGAYGGYILMPNLTTGNWEPLP